MGPTNIGDVLATIGAIETALKQCGYAFTSGAGVAAAQAAYQRAIA
jgi:aspartate aminotransferase-like enzyme